MYQFNYSNIFVFTFLLSRVYSDIQFNSLSEKLVLNLIKLTPQKNVVASEHLVRTALCKLASIAKGKAKRELLLLLGYQDDVVLRTCYSNVAQYINTMVRRDLTVTNRIYVAYKKDIDKNFIEKSSENDGVQVEKVGFDYPKAAIAHINHLVSSMTFQRITNIVDRNDINKTTKMIIISGAHYKGTWEIPFDYRLTKLTRFHHINGKTSRIPMMITVDEFLYNKAANCEVLTLRLQSFMTSIIFVVPNTHKELPRLLETIYKQKGFVSGLAKRSQLKLMKVTIPRFKIKTFVDWTGFIQELGLYSIFNSNSSDLAGIFKAESQNQTIHLSKIKQKVFIQIDEMGAARTVPDLLHQEPLRMPNYGVPGLVVDRPFYFEVGWDLNNSRYAMFSGVYYGPEPELGSF